MNYNCRICGFKQEEMPWGNDGNSPNYEICNCCGVEFGNEDYTLKSIHEYRKEWIKNGNKWFNENFKPIKWNLENQLKNIPIEFMNN